MKQLVLAALAGVVMLGVGVPAVCEDGSTTAAEAKSSTSTDSKSDEEKIRLEREARKEAEKRDRIERRHRHNHDYYGTDPTGGTTTSESLGAPGLWREFTAGVVFAPGHAGREPAIGLQYMSQGRWGLSLWLSGSLDRDGDVIDAPIPHEDYYGESVTGSYGLQSLYRAGSEDASVILGAGFVVEQALYTAVSNVTGWKWNNGSSTVVKPAAQIGCRLRLGRTVGLNMGYDTHQYSFFGLSARF